MNKIIILDFGSQTTQLIGRRVRELGTFCEILPYDSFPADNPDVIGVILSGSPLSVYAPDALLPDLSGVFDRYPVLGICYGAQLISFLGGGKVENSGTREYGRALLNHVDGNCSLFDGIGAGSQVWMSHGDSITALPSGFRLAASNTNSASSITLRIVKDVARELFHMKHILPTLITLSRFSTATPSK